MAAGVRLESDVQATSLQDANIAAGMINGGPTIPFTMHHQRLERTAIANP